MTLDRSRRLQMTVVVCVCSALLLAKVPAASAQVPATAPARPATAPVAAGDKAPLKKEELEQLVAAIALYPDPLITQILMASTYPLEIVQADRFAKANKQLKGKELTTELEKQTWDASVKSLVNFPDVLAMMSEKLDLSVRLGDAFIGQQADVMNSIQNLRTKAKAAGHLKDTEQQKLVMEALPATAPATDPAVAATVTTPPAQIIRIEPTSPEVIYVPSYSPSVVYGYWPYPAYPPAPYYPPGYVASSVFSFGLGVACGAAWGYAWGNCNWGNNDVDIDIDRNTNINTNIDRSKYKAEAQNRQANRSSQTGRASSWQHDAKHRQGVPYRDKTSADRFGGTQKLAQTSQAREAYRGRADAGRADLARGSAGSFAGSGAGAANRPNPADRSGGSIGGAGGGRTTPGGSAADRPSTFDGVDRGGTAARTSSDRGQTSRYSPSSSSANRSSGSYSGGSRSPSGGGARSSGGGSRGGGGGGGRRR